MKNIAMRIAYDGTNYHGWQYQENAMTVQETVENALSALCGENIRVTGCSRTDAGVHAADFVFNFRSDTSIPTDKLPYALNDRLRDEQITASKAWIADDDFSARFSAKGKRYVYLINNSAFRDPFYSRYSWHFPYKLDLEKMQSAARHFEGEHDFCGFMASGGQQKTTVRNINLCAARRDAEDSNIIKITVEANAFLYNMVRIIAGTIVYVGCGKLEASDIPAIIAGGDRTAAGITAPPHGLFLKKVYY